MMNASTVVQLPTTKAPASLSNRGWNAELKLGFENRQSRTVLASRRRRGPLAIQRPFYPEGARCHVYLLHPPGGIVGGDTLEVEVDAKPDTRCLITTPGATKFYRTTGQCARTSQTLHIANNADVEWLPAETIYFSGCNARVDTHISLADDASFTYWDIQCFGRPASDEAFDDGAVDISLAISRDEQPLLLERQRINPQTRHYSSLLAGHAVSGILIASSTDETVLSACREISDQSNACALTQIDDLLMARYLGPSTKVARQIFNALWLTLRQYKSAGLASTPRIWLT